MRQAGLNERQDGIAPGVQDVTDHMTFGTDLE
jgi:hypothetical protein